MTPLLGYNKRYCCTSVNSSSFNLVKCCFPVAVFLLLLLRADCESQSSSTVRPRKKVHFMFEFVPSFSNQGIQSPRECQEDEVRTIQDFISGVIREDTGFSRRHSHRHVFLDGHYNAGRHPGFDLTYECPRTCEGFPTDWCRMLCEEDLTHLGQHEPLNDVADDLLERIHHTTKKGHDRMFAVECLGDLDTVDLHMVVSTSPFIEKRGWVDMRSEKSKRRSEM